MDTAMSYATGKRKNAIARTWLTPGTGQVIINRRSVGDYFQRASHRLMMQPPLELTGLSGKYDIFATVRGGGQTGQVLALRHAVSKAIVGLHPTHREILKKRGFSLGTQGKRNVRSTVKKAPEQSFSFPSAEISSPYQPQSLTLLMVSPLMPLTLGGTNS